MYFWKIENLKKDIKTKQFTEKDRFIYMFISLIIFYFMISALTLMPHEDSDMWEVVYSLLDMFIIFLGTFLVFKANGGAEGVDFLGKFFSITFVVNLRFIALLIVLIIPIFIIIYYFYASTNTQEMEVSPILQILLPSIWQIVIYWRIIKHTKDVKEV